VGKRYLIFFEVRKGVLDPYRGIEGRPDGDLVNYFRGAVAAKYRSMPEWLRHAFDHLCSPDPVIAQDAFREFPQESYKDWRTAVKGLPAGEIVRRLSDPKTPLTHYSLYGLLLAECGAATDAEALRQRLNALGQSANSSMEGLLTGYVILQPNQGWAHLRALLADGKQPWIARFSALRTLRLFWEQRPGVLPKADLVDGVLLSMAVPDMTDLAIEELRKWQCLGLCDRILPLFGKEGYEVPIIRRSIIRYALCSPEPRAAAFIREQRRLDPELIDDQIELLKLESPPAKAP
jgi:hypothetical protein